MWNLSDYDFDLPESLIAQTPTAKRDDSKLLCVDERFSHRRTSDFADAIPSNAVLVLNDTRVVPARLWVRKATGGKVELFFTKPFAKGSSYECLMRGAKKLKVGMVLSVGGEELVVEQLPESGSLGKVTYSGTLLELLKRHGKTPLPPYIRREVSDRDEDRYQTVFAKVPGAVAAPTASLHLTDEFLRKVKAKGVSVCFVTLHVGLGTFHPLRRDDFKEERLHSEYYEVGKETAALCSSGRPVVAVGTTVTRALESAALQSGAVVETCGDTELFIKPGFEFRVVDYLLTNFHLPKSSLLILVSAFGGFERIRKAYQEAIQKEYRFYSYGDAMLVKRHSGS